jgi:hypothetical protein
LIFGIRIRIGFERIFIKIGKRFVGIRIPNLGIRLTTNKYRKITRQQRCQMNFFKSARSDVKIRQNPPRRIGQIRQKSARNWDDFRPFFTLRLVFVAFLVRILPYLRSDQRQIFISLFKKKYLTEYLFILKLF